MMFIWEDDEMKDAFAQIARDQEREDSLAKLKSAIDVYKYNPTADNRQKAIDAAEEVDSVEGGSNSSRRFRAEYSKTIEGELDSIVNG